MNAALFLILISVVSILVLIVVRQQQSTASQRELKSQLSEHVQTIIELRQKLESSARLATLGEMVGGIAHEINNPLAIIQGKAEQLLRAAESTEIDKANLKKSAEKIKSTVHRIASIVKSMRSLARMGNSDPLEKTDIRALLQDVIILCEGRLRESSVSVEVLPSEDGLSTECRRAEISQVVFNLLSNALDAVSACEEKWIRIAIEKDNAFIDVSVTDSGKGIPRDLQSKIMQPFFTTKPLDKGTGLGLSISKSIAESHRGQLLLDKISSNTKFILKLPAMSST